MEDNDYGMKPELPKGLKIIKLVFKSVMLALIIFVYGFFTLRICTSKPEQNIIWTEKTLEAYSSDKENFVIYTQEPQVFIDEHDGEEQTGFNLSVFHIAYIPSAQQLQVTVRYNKSALPQLKEKYEDFDSEETVEPFVYSLLLENGERITGYTYKAEKTNRYYFKYLVFDGVDLESYTLQEFTAENSAEVDENGNIIAHVTDGNGNKIVYQQHESGKYIVYDTTYIYLDAYYINNVDFNETPDASLMVYNRALELKKLSKSKYDPEQGKTEGVSKSPYFVDRTSESAE